MDAVWQELIRAVPWGAVIIILRWLDLKAEAEARKERALNAAEKALHDRETQIMINQSFASAINNLAKVTDDSTNRMIVSMTELRETLSEQYSKMGITADLLDMARAELAKKQP